MNVESRGDTSFSIKNIIPLLGLESFKMEKQGKQYADPNWMSYYYLKVAY